MCWKVVTPQETKKQTRMVSALGEWIATWGSSGLFGIASSEGSFAPMQTGVHAPDWLAAGWERYWNGKTFDVCLCTEKIPSVSTAAVWNTVLAVSFGETLSYVSSKCSQPGQGASTSTMVKFMIFFVRRVPSGRDQDMSTLYIPGTSIPAMAMFPAWSAALSTPSATPHTAENS